MDSRINAGRILDAFCFGGGNLDSTNLCSKGVNGAGFSGESNSGHFEVVLLSRGIDLDENRK